MSEPIFEASVRLQADVSDFETQAKASLKRVTDQAERQAAALQQKVNTTLLPPGDLRGGPGIVPPIAPVEVPVKLDVPPIEIPPVPPVEVPVDVTVPPVEVPPVPPVTIPVSVDQQAIAQQLATARALASAPLDIEMLANTKPFERDSAVAFQQAITLAQQRSDQLAASAVTAAQESKAAIDAVFSAKGAERETAVVTAQARQSALAEARRIAEEARLQVQQIVGEAETARLRPATELQTRSQTAATQARSAELRGDVPAQQAAELEAAVLGLQSSAESMALSSENILTQAATMTGANKDLLLAQAEEATLAAEKLRAEANRLQAAGPGAPPTGPPGSGGPNEPGGFRRFLNAGIEGRSSGIAELVRQGSRLGLIGIAATAAFQTVGELGKALRVTGDEAATAQGRFRNFGAEILSFNPVGAIEALTATRKAIIDPAITSALQEQKNLIDPLAVSQEKLIELQNKGGDALKDELAILVTFGGVSIEQANKIGDLTQKWADQQKQLEETTTAVSEYNRELEAAGGNAAKLFGPDSGGNLRGGLLGAPPVPPAGTVIGQQRTGIPQPIISAGPNPAFQAGTGGEAVANQIRASLTSRIQDDERRSQLEVRDAQIVEKQAKAAFETAKKVAESNHQANGAAAEWAKYQLAVTGVAEATAAAKETTARAAAEAADLDKRIRDAQTARITEPHAQAAAQLRDATADVAAAEKARDATRSGTRARKEAEAAYQEALTAQTAAQQSVNDLAASDAATARSKAEAAAASTKSAKEQALANDITRAQLEGDKAATIKAFNVAISYYRTLQHEAGITAEAREAAQAKVLELTGGLKAARQGGEVVDPAALRQQQLTNALTAAEQTGSIALQRRAAQHLVDFWREQVKGATGVEKAQAQAALLGAKERREQVDQQADSLAELRIRNRAALAQLNDNPEAEKRAADDLIKFWERQVKNATGYEKAQANASLIAARLARKGLDDSEKATTTVFDLLSKTAARFSEFSGNLIDKNNPFTRESFVGEQAQFFKPGVNPGDIEAGPTGFAADLNAFRERNDRLGKIPGSGLDQSLDRNTQATDRLTDALLGSEGFGKHGYDDGTPKKKGGGFAWSGGDFWKARQARQAAEAGMGATAAGF